MWDSIRNSFSGASAPAAVTPPKRHVHPTSPLAKDLLHGAGFGSHHGVPSDVTTVAYEDKVGILAMGTSRGCIKVVCSDGIEITLYDGKQPLNGMSYDSGAILQVPVQHLLFLEGGTALVAVFRNAAMQVWDLRSRRLLGCLNQAWTMTGIHVIAAHPQTGVDGGNYVFIGGDTGIVSVVKVLPHCRVCGGYIITREEALELSKDDGIEDEVISLAVCPTDPSQLLIGYGISGFVLWDLPGRYQIKYCCREKKLVQEPAALLKCASWHPDGRYIATGYSDGTFEIWCIEEMLRPMRQTVNDSGLKRTGGLDDDDLGEGTPLSMEDIKFIRPSPELPTALAVLGGVSKPMMYAGGRDGMAGSVHFTCAHILLPEQVAQDICNGGGGGGGGDEDHPPEVVKPRRKSLWKSLAAMTGIHSKIDIGGQYKCVSSFAPADGEAASISVAVISNTPSSHNSLTATDRHEKKALFGSRRRATSQHGTADHSEDAHPTWSSVSSVMTLVGLRGGVEVMRATPFQQSYPVALPTPICAGGLPGDSFITLALETDVNASLWEQLLDSERDTHRRETAPNSFLRHGSWVTSTTSTPQKVAMPFSAVAVAHSDGSVSLIGLSRDRNDESFGKSLKSLNRSFDNDDTNSEDEESEDDDEDDEEGSAASHRPNVAPQTTPSALTLSRIGVKKILETDLLDEEKSGHLQVTSVSLLLEHGLCCIAVGGEHKCSGQVALMQLCSVDGRESAVGDLAEEPAEKSVDIVGSKAAPPPIQNTVVDKVDNNDSDSDSDLSIDDMVAASRREAESLVASPMSADDIDIPSSPRSASSTASGLKDKKEEAGGKCKYIWKRAYKLVAHDTAVRCLTTGVSSNGCVMIACADGGGVVSVTDTRTGCTRLLPCGETRGGLVQSKTQVRDQRIVKLSFGSKTFMANDKGTSLLCIGLACGEVQVLDTSSMTIVNIFITNQQQAGSSINLSTAAINLPSASQSGCSLTQVIPSKKQSSSPLLLVAAGVNVSLYQLNKHNAVASVQLGATPIMAATLLATSEYNGHLAVAFTSDWVAYVIAVNEAPNAGLKVLGMKQIQPPGGAPPWETAPVIGDASSSTAKAFERKVVAPGGGGVAIDDSEAEAGGPGWRCIFSKWGELLVTAHGSTELLRLPVVDWSPLALAPASGVIDMSGSGKLDMSALMQEVNIGPEFRAELPLPSTQSLRGSMSGAGATGPTGADEAAPPPPPPTEHNTPRRSSLFRLSSTTKSPPQQTSTPTSSVVDDEDDVEETVNNTNNNIDLAAVFDHFDRPAIHYEEGEKAEDLSHLSPEERTKRLLEQRGEALANMEDKSRKVAEAAEAYRDGTAKIKQEAVKQNKKWPF